jgi:hypothetical protein
LITSPAEAGYGDVCIATDDGGAPPQRRYLPVNGL